MTYRQAIACCALAAIFVTLQYGAKHERDRHTAVLQMTLERNYELEEQVARLTPPTQDEIEMTRLLAVARKDMK